MKFAIGLALMLAILFSATSATAVLLSDQGTDVKEISTGNNLALGNLTILVYTASTGGAPLYNYTFANAIINGSWNVMTNSSLEYGNSYWKDYEINGENLNFSGADRLEFQSPLGLINNASYFNFSLIGSCPAGSSIRLVNANGSVSCETDDIGGGIGGGLIAGGIYLYNDTTAIYLNDTVLNATIDSRTAYANGTGLELSGKVFRLLTTCGDDQVLKWNSTSSAWQCANDLGGAETDPNWFANFTAYNDSWTSTYNLTYASWNKTYADTLYFSNITNFTGTLTDTKYCTYDAATGKIVCDSGGSVSETDPYWYANYTAYNDTWSSTYNLTYDAKAGTGNCPDGQVVMNTTASGVECVVPPGGAETDPNWFGNSTAVAYIANQGDWDVNSSVWWAGYNSPPSSWTDTYNSTYATWAYNQTSAAITYADSLYYGISNPNGYYNATTIPTYVTIETDPYWSGNSTDVLNWNKTYADTLYASINLAGDNASWNKSYADTLYYDIGNPNGYYNATTIPSYISTETDPAWFANFTAYNDTWTSTYNETYESWNKTYADTLYAGIDEPQWLGNSTTVLNWNKTYADTLYASIGLAGDNASWNQSFANELYAPINEPQWLANESTVARVGECPSSEFVVNTTTGGVECAAPAAITETDPEWFANFTAYNDTWTSTYNETYESWNKSYADTLYYDISNPNSYYNSTTIPAYISTETDPNWFANFTAYNDTWSSTYNATYNTWAYNQTSAAITYADSLYAGITEPQWLANFTAYNDTWSSTYNATYAGYNSSGFITNWSRAETDPAWFANFTAYNNTWTSTYNETYANWNKTYSDTLYVPYSGSTGKVTLNSYNFSVGSAFLVDTAVGQSKVGIGINNPAVKLHIKVDDILGLPALSDTDVLLQDTSTDTDIAALALVGGNGTGSSVINFGDSQDVDAGKIDYDHGTDSFIFSVNGIANQFILDSSGNGTFAGAIAANDWSDVSITSSQITDFSSIGNWSEDKPNYYNKTDSDARYLQSYTEGDPEWFANFTLYNDTWTSTYNATYDAKVSDNSSWNQSFANTLYATIDEPKWNANYSNVLFKTTAWTNCSAGQYTKGIYGSTLDCEAPSESDPNWFANFTAYNDTWTLTYNSTYNTWAYNQTTPAILAAYNGSLALNSSLAYFYPDANPYGYYNSTNPQAESDPNWYANQSSYAKLTDVDNATIIRSGNGSWLTTAVGNWTADKSSYLTAESDPAWFANFTLYNDTWTSTYNATYDAKVSDNSSWNQSFANVLYAPINEPQWLGNYSSFKPTLWNGKSDNVSVVNDTNVGGVAQGSQITLKWISTLADARIASAANWQGKQANVSFINDTNLGMSFVNGTAVGTAFWISTLADSRIASAANWNGKQANMSFANDTNLAISVLNSTGVATLRWLSTLADARIASAANWNGKQTNITIGNETNLDGYIAANGTIGLTWQGTLADGRIASATTWNNWNKTYADTLYFSNIANFTGTLTDAKYCIYDDGTKKIVCNSGSTVTETDPNWLGNYSSYNPTLWNGKSDNLTFVNETNLGISAVNGNRVLHWIGTLADARIASAATWNAKANATGFVTNWVNKTTIANTTTVVNMYPIHELSWGLVANANYTFDCYITFNSSATTTGIGLAFYAGADNSSTMAYTVMIPNGADYNNTYSGAGTASNDSITSLFTPVAALDYTARLYGTLYNNGTATVAGLTFRTEVATSRVYIRRGICSVMQIT